MYQSYLIINLDGVNLTKKVNVLEDWQHIMVSAAAYIISHSLLSLQSCNYRHTYKLSFFCPCDLEW